MARSRMSTDVFTRTMTDGTATVAEVIVSTDEFTFRGRGSSRRMAGDANDIELGEILAVVRALENVVDSMNAKARRLIAVNDKKASEAANWKSKEQWEAEQEAAKQAAMKAHPAGKAKNAAKDTGPKKTAKV